MYNFLSTNEELILKQKIITTYIYIYIKYIFIITFGQRCRKNKKNKKSRKYKFQFPVNKPDELILRRESSR